MKRLSVVLTFTLAGVVAALPARSAPVELLPLDQIRPGMTGVGHTVFEGSRIEEFRVVVIGVLNNIGPKQSMILARLEGGPLENTGVIAGMSGSPVFIGGKLVGAVAYGFPFSKETIAGITPISEMIEATAPDQTRARGTGARSLPPLSRERLSQPLDRDALLSWMAKPDVSVSPRGPSGLLPRGLAGTPLRPLAVPLTFTGFQPAAFELARGVFGDLGFVPMVGGAGESSSAAPLPDLAPGAPVGLSLIEGDLDISATGTITHIDNGRVYAFGHPFFNLGPTQFPMKKAYVYSVFPSLYQSWKISTAMDQAVGTIEQDRQTAIAGTIGKPPRMIPVDVHLTTSRGQERRYSLRMVDDEMFSPLLAYISLVSILQGSERAFGTSSLRMAADITLAGGRMVSLDDLFSERDPSAETSALVSGALAYLMSNESETVGVEKLEVRITSSETVQSASVERAWIERSGPIRAGTSFDLKVQLRGYRGDTWTETFTVPVPANAGPGRYTLLVADAATLTSVEQREMRQAFIPRDLDQLVRALNGLRHGNTLYVRILRAEPGAVVAGEYLQSLPPSVLAVVQAAAGDDVAPVRTASVWDDELELDVAVSGSRTLTLNVER